MRLIPAVQTVKEAVDAARLHHQLLPMQLQYEAGTTRWLVDGLAGFGHKEDIKISINLSLDICTNTSIDCLY